VTSAAIILAGGRSSRMGTPKAALPWHGSTLLRRVTDLAGRVVDGPVVVVRAAGQELPALPAHVRVTEDPREGLGPVQGLAAGLAAVAGEAERAFLCATDMPFLHPAFARAVLGAVTDDVDVALPHARGYPQPLAAGYRTALAGLVEQMVRDELLRPAFLFERCRVRRLRDSDLLADPLLAALDPELDSVRNLNDRADYDAATAVLAPEVTVQRFGALARTSPEGARPGVVRAATLAEASAAVGITLDEHVIAALNGDQISRDGELPLVAGDSVAFLSADAGG
jgi:molybdopterin-guanine dinucleotide biosynthesis protein A